MCAKHYQRLRIHGSTDDCSKTLADRFWPRVAITGPNECWLWVGPLDLKGYGIIGRGGGGAGIERTHRIAWVLTHGPIPDGLCVCHHCDVRNCCNASDHLFLGTSADNMADMTRKDRHGSAKLTCAQRDEIRRRYAAGGVTQNALAIEFGVGGPNVNRIVNRGKRHI